MAYCRGGAKGGAYCRGGAKGGAYCVQVDSAGVLVKRCSQCEPSGGYWGGGSGC